MTYTARVGDMVNATMTAGMAERMGPKVGTISRIPERRARGRALGMPKSVSVIQEISQIKILRTSCPLSHAPNLALTWSSVERT